MEKESVTASNSSASVINTEETIKETKSKVLSKKRVGNYVYKMVGVPKNADVEEAEHREDINKTTNADKVEGSSRKSISPTFKVPPHIMGRNVENPELDGKKAPKPRPGVKVPNLNLTSQILTQEELYREVAQRSSSSSSTLLPKQLTSKLAAKLASTEEANKVNEDVSEESNSCKKESLLDLMKQQYTADLSGKNSKTLAADDKPDEFNNESTTVRLEEMDVEAAVAALHGESIENGQVVNATLSDSRMEENHKSENMETAKTPKKRKRATKSQAVPKTKQVKSDSTKLKASKARKRVSNELNQLFIDEGAINMLREMEKSGRASRRSGSGQILQSLIPEDLLEKKTLNAIRTTGVQQKRKPTIQRGKKKTPNTKTSQETKKKGSSPWEAVKVLPSRSSSDVPGKDVFVSRNVENPADASRIIRRRSCSSSTDEDEEEKVAVTQNGEGNRRASEILAEGSHLRELGKLHESSKFDMRDLDKLEEVRLRRAENYAHVILTLNGSTITSTLSNRALIELRRVLEHLNNEESVAVVLVTSTGPAFCHGIDIPSLIKTDKDELQSVSTEVASNLQNLFKELNHFSKILIAGVNGAVVGTAVSMLPFFDVVFASEKATFQVPCAKLGQTTEGALAVTLQEFGSKRLSSSLLYEGKRLTALEAERCGLVNSVLWPSTFHEDLIPRVQQIASQSAKAMLAIKKLQNQRRRPEIDTLLQSEAELQVQCWTSDEFQKRARVFVENFNDTV